MSREKSATSWEIREFASSGFALAVGAGGYFYQFRSPSVKGVFTVAFAGGGIGIGGGISINRKLFDKKAKWSPIEARVGFSMNDLDGSEGQIISGNAFGLIDVVEISAWKGRKASGERDGLLFWGSPVGGARIKKNASITPKLRLQFSQFVGKWGLVS